MQALGFFAPFLVGKTYTDSDDVTFVVESLSRSQQAVVSSSNPVEKRTISQLDAFKEIIKSTKYGYKKRRYSLFVKTVSVALYNRGAKYLEAMGEAQKALKMNVNRKRDLTTKSKQQRKESKGESHYLPQCKDTTYAKSLETQMATVEESLQKWTAKLMQLQEIRKCHLVTFQEVVEFMENYLGVRVPCSTFGRWVKEGFSGKFAGRPPGGIEEDLAIHALFMDKIGLPMSRKLLEGLAVEIAAKTNTKTTIGHIINFFPTLLSNSWIAHQK